jgi:putative colanic acid biosynthesis acetyltransferase WcaF
MKLDEFNNSWYQPGGYIKRWTWYVVNRMFFVTSIPYPYVVKRMLLRLYGARIGKRVVIMPNVSIKYPWNIGIGNHSWVGEGVWLQSLGSIDIKENVCISQGVKILTGNHNYKKKEFDLIVSDTLICKGAWIGAFSVLCPGITVGKYSVLTVSSVAKSSLDPNLIYAGNPAVFVRKRYDNEG